MVIRIKRKMHNGTWLLFALAKSTTEAKQKLQSLQAKDLKGKYIIV